MQTSHYKNCKNGMDTIQVCRGCFAVINIKIADYKE